MLISPFPRSEFSSEQFTEGFGRRMVVLGLVSELPQRAAGVPDGRKSSNDLVEGRTNKRLAL